MKAHASVRIDIPFHDVDAMRIVWHGNYARYFEIARTALLRQYQLDYPEMEASGWLFPVIRMDCRYLSPLRYGDIALVEVIVEEAEFKMVLGYKITQEKSGKKIATGHTEHAVLDAGFNLLMPIPVALRERFVEGGAPSAPP